MELFTEYPANVRCIRHSLISGERVCMYAKDVYSFRFVCRRILRDGDPNQIP